MSNFEAPKAVLVADDQMFIRSLLVSMLRELGYKPLEAADGDQALQQLVLRPDVIILDQRMAGRTGLEILQAIRCGKTKRPRDLPVLLLTGHADENIVRIAGKLDVSALLTKPVSKTQLNARLDAATKARITLRSPQSYASIDVKPAEAAAEPRQTSNAWILKSAMGEREAPYVSGAEMARRASAAALAARGGETHYSRVRPGMKLAKDLYSDSGQLIVAGGLELSQDMVKRLVRICEASSSLRYLDVAPERKV